MDHKRRIPTALVSTTTLAIVFITLASACTTVTQIFPPSAAPTDVSRDAVPLFIDDKHAPGDFSLRLYAPAGNDWPIRNAPGELGRLLKQRIERIAEQKGYVLVNHPRDAAFVLVIDYQRYQIDWRAGFLSSNGDASIEIEHRFLALRPTTQVTRWAYEEREEFGWLPGNCIGSMLGCTIVGLIPWYVYIYAVAGDEGQQMMTWGNMEVARYLKSVEARLPAAAAATQLRSNSGVDDNPRRAPPSRRPPDEALPLDPSHTPEDPERY